MAIKNIEMMQKNSSGTYDRLVPYAVAYDDTCYITKNSVHALGISENSTPADAFEYIGNKLQLIANNKAKFKLIIKDQQGRPVSNFNTRIVLDDSGNVMKTNSEGIADGYVANGTQVLKLDDYADIEPFSKTYNIIKGNTYTEQITLNFRSNIEITQSTNIRFSDRVSKIDYLVVGGGSGGYRGQNRSNSASSGRGGNGAEPIKKDSVSVSPDKNYEVVVGAGGLGEVRDSQINQKATSGGSSSFMGTISNGGDCNSDNGNGGASVNESSWSGQSNGLNGTGGMLWNGQKYGGGGGSGGAALANSNSQHATGGKGANAGGDGGDCSANNDGPYSGNYVVNPGTDGTRGGGGGGGSAASLFQREDSGASNGGNGGTGCVAIKVYFK